MLTLIHAKRTKALIRLMTLKKDYVCALGSEFSLVSTVVIR